MFNLVNFINTFKSKKIANIYGEYVFLYYDELFP